MGWKRESGEEIDLKPKPLDPEHMQGVRGKLKGVVCPERRKIANESWMRKLRQGDYEGPVLDRTRYLALRDVKIEGNPRQTEEYRARCREAVGVGEVIDEERYKHLKEPDFAVIRWTVSRGSGCMWLPDTPRTTVKGFQHRLITKGPPVRVKLFRLNRPDTEWLEKAIQEDVARG